MSFCPTCNKPHSRPLGRECYNCEGEALNAEQQTRETIEYRRIPAQDVKPGQVVMSQGYAWRVNAVHVSPKQIILACDNVARPDGVESVAPPGYAKDMHLGFTPGATALVCQ